MKIIVYEPDYNEKHREVLRSLAAGIPGAKVRTLGRYEPCDIAVIFGLVKKAFRPTHDKMEIIDRHEGKRLIVVESAFIKRGEYFSVGWKGINGNADFNNENSDGDRWKKLNVKIKPWKRNDDGHVVICGQLPRDTNVQDMNHAEWCRSAVRNALNETHKVIFRPHPLVSKPDIYGIDKRYIDRNEKLSETLNGARCIVFWNSNSGVDALINGVPIVAEGHDAFTKPLSSQSINKIKFPSRRSFFHNLAYCQWTLNEMRSGETWKHLTGIR